MTGKKGKAPKGVKEPIQVYLTPDERNLLDRMAEEAEISRAEVLRRGLRSFAAHQAGAAGPMISFMDSLAGYDFPEDTARKHDDYLTQSYLDTHDQ